MIHATYVYGPCLYCARLVNASYGYQIADNKDYGEGLHYYCLIMWGPTRFAWDYPDAIILGREIWLSGAELVRAA
jgi:hypothetical protein